MADESIDEGVGLAEFIRALRGEIQSAVAEGKDSKVRFKPGGFRHEVQPVDSIDSSSESSGFPFQISAFCSVSRGRRRFGEKEYPALSVTPGVALRVGTQGGPTLGHERPPVDFPAAP